MFAIRTCFHVGGNINSYGWTFPAQKCSPVSVHFRYTLCWTSGLQQLYNLNFSNNGVSIHETTNQFGKYDSRLEEYTVRSTKKICSYILKRDSGSKASQKKEMSVTEFVHGTFTSTSSSSLIATKFPQVILVTAISITAHSNAPRLDQESWSLKNKKIPLATPPGSGLHYSS